MPGTASHYDETPPAKRQPVYAEDNWQVIELPDDFYSTTFYTDRMLEFPKSTESDDKPFFAFLPCAAPHFPLQAPDPYIARYEGVYDVGYEPIRSALIDKVKFSGVLPPDLADSPPPPGTIAWDAWPSDVEQKFEARRMQVYG